MFNKTAGKTALLSSLVAAIFATQVQASEISDINKLMRAGQYAEALTKTDAILTKHPRDAQLRFTKGLILAEQNRSAEAIAIFTKLTEDFPDLPEPYNNLAVLYAANGQYDKARASLDMAMRTNPTYATALDNLGDVYAKLASQAYDKALQIDPAANVPQPKLTLLRSLNGNTTGGTPPKLASAAQSAKSAAVQSPQDAQAEAKAKADATAAEQKERAKALATEKAAQQAAADKAAAEKAAIDKAAADKAAAEKAIADKAAAEKAAADKLAADKAAATKAAAEKAAADKAAADKAAQEKAKEAKLAKAEQEQKQREKEKAAQAEKAEKEKLAKLEKEKALQAERQAAADKAAQAKAAAEKAKADKARAVAESDQDKNAVLAALNSWARDWSEKDVRGYLSHYATDFDTPKGLSRKEWAEERRARIEDKGHISVKVSNAQIVFKGNTATVRYRQIYNSNRLTVDSRKTLVFVKQGNKWLIKQERSGG